MTSKDKNYEAVGQLKIDFSKVVMAANESEAWTKVAKEIFFGDSDIKEMILKLSDGKVIKITEEGIIDYELEMNDELQEK